MHRPVLILGAEPRVAVTVARSLRRHQIPVVVAGFMPEERRFYSRAIQQWVDLPHYRRAPGESVEALISLLSVRHFDMLIPITDTALTMLIEQHETLRQLTHLACPEPVIARRVLDKRLTFEAAMRCGVPVPATFHIASLAELGLLGPRLPFPLIAKPKNKTANNPFKVQYFRNLDELTVAFRAYAQFGTQNMIQEFAHGDGVGIGVLMHQRRPVAMFQHRRLKELPATGGVSVMAVAEALDPLLVEHATSLLKEIEWEGIAMVEFKYDRRNRRPALMEVNGRYWGSVSLAVQSGVDFPFIEWRIRQGELPEGLMPYKVGTRWRWGTGDLLRIRDLLSKPREDEVRRFSLWSEVIGFLFDFRPGTRSALWSFSDPIPALQEFSREIKIAIKAAAKRVVRSVLPPTMLERARTYRALPSPVARVYLERQIRRALRLHRDRGRTIPRDVDSIMFVCHGNIMRSPLAEAMLRSRINASLGNDVRITSAGTHARNGKQADPRVVALGRDFDLDLTPHRAELVTPESLRRADVVFAMDYTNEATLIALAPDVAERIYLLGSFGHKVSLRSVEIPDPFDGGPSDVRQCGAVLDSCVAELARKLLNPTRTT